MRRGLRINHARQAIARSISAAAIETRTATALAAVRPKIHGSRLDMSRILSRRILRSSIGRRRVNPWCLCLASNMSTVGTSHVRCRMDLSNDPRTKWVIWPFGHVTNTFDIVRGTSQQLTSGKTCQSLDLVLRTRSCCERYGCTHGHELCACVYEATIMVNWGCFPYNEKAALHRRGFMSTTERCWSGRTGLPAKQLLGQNPCRGFESPPLRFPFF